MRQRRDGQRRVTVASGAALVVKKATTIAGTLTATGAEAVQALRRHGQRRRRVRNSTRDVTIAGSRSTAASADGNTQVSANDRYSRLAGAYGPILAGSTCRA